MGELHAEIYRGRYRCTVVIKNAEGHTRSIRTFANDEWDMISRVIHSGKVRYMDTQWEASVGSEE